VLSGRVVGAWGTLERMAAAVGLSVGVEQGGQR
jgi:hypothetical protein